MLCHFRTALFASLTVADEIYMATGKNGEYKKIKTITKNTTVTYTKSSLAKGTYSFIMRAYKTVDGTKLYGDFSKVKSVSIK